MCEISRKRNNVNGINEDNGSSNTNNRRFNLNISLIPSRSDNFNIVTHRSILNIQTTKLSVKLASNSELINNKIDPLINNSTTTTTLNKHYCNNKNIIDRNVTFNNEEDLNERQFSHRFSTSFGADRNIFHHRRSHSHHQYSSFANESLDNPLNRSVSVDDGQKQHHHHTPPRNISNIELTETSATTRLNRVNLKNISHIELSDDDSHNNNPKSENINELKSNFKQFHRKTSSFVDCVSLINSRYPTFVTNFNNLSDRIAAAATTTPITSTTTDRSNDFDSITFGRSYTRATQRLNTITAGTNTSTKSTILVNTGQNCPRGERKKDSNKLTRYRYDNLFYSLQLIPP